ncbi:MAG TPA: hypothetical protein VFI47_07795 [Acidimicrobiales bacterium]|nr:hypothetical protein [Acidimicrobiales bacterium]
MDWHRSDPEALATAAPDVLGGDLSARLERWAEEARVDEAARLRSREGWLRRQAEEESTLAGVLVDLLEAAEPVTIHTRAGRRHAGVVRAVGADVAVLGRSGGAVAVALHAIASLHTGPGAGAVLGDRAAGGALRLADMLTGLVAARERVLVVTLDGAAVSGVVRSVGGDVVVVRGTGAPAATCYIPLAAIGEVVLDHPHP